MIAWPDAPNDSPLGDGRFASAVDRPNTVDELRQVVTSRSEQGLAVYPQGGRTALDYGGVPRSPGAAVDLTGLDRMVDYPVADMTITVEAGMPLPSLRAILEQEGQRLVLDAPNSNEATIGGVFATGFSGPRRFGGGRPRDQIIGVKFVSADGVLLKGGGRVVKNVAGYDFPRLLTGSLGTLGIITELTLKVRPAPESYALAWIGLPDSGAVESALTTLNTSATRPMAVELLNRPAAGAIGGPVNLPAHPWVIVVLLEDNRESVDWQVDALRKEVPGSAFEVRREEEAGRASAHLLPFADAAEGTLGVVATIRPSAVATVSDRLDPGRWSVQSHAGNGIVRAFARGDWTPDEAERAIASLRADAAAAGGAVVISRCPPIWKERLKVWGDPRPDWALAEGIKRALDPRGVLNPGRFVGRI